MSANSTETEAAVLALSKALGSQNTGMKVVPSAPPADDSDSSNGSRHSDDLQVHEWELSKDEILRRAEAGDTSCKFLAGIGFAKGHLGFPYDREQANKWLLGAKTYRRDAPNSDIHVIGAAEGFCYQFGFGDITRKEIDLQKARSMYSGATDYIPARFFYAQFRYETKVADNPQFVKSRHIMIKSIIDAVQECVDAKFTPAYDFAAHRHFDRWEGFGDGYGAINEVEGIRLLREAENLGDSPARVSLSQIYYGGGYGLAEDVKEAQRLLLLAVADNIPVAKDLLKLRSAAATKNMTPAPPPPPPMILSPTIGVSPPVVQTRSQQSQQKKKKSGCVLI